MTNAPQLRPLGDTLGTEALGVDLSQSLDAATFAWVAQAFAEHPVLVFRDQDLGAPELASFGRRFGTPRVHALIKYRHAECPEVSWLTNVEDGGKVDWYGVKRATDWHTDSTYEDALPMLAILHAKEVPSEKGGTMFADMRAAYDALPGDRKQLLSGLVGLHSRSTGPAGERLYGDDKGITEKKYDEVPWPAVTQHPVTGRQILFVNPMHTHGFVGMARDEAWPLIEELAEHATQDRFVYYHRWRVGDVLMWDERATMHRGAGDYRPEEHRVMLRTIVYPNEQYQPMPKFQVTPDLAMHYRVDDFTDPWSEPQTILMLHGNAESGLAWYAWVPKLARQYRVVRPDMRGFGESTAMPADYPWTLDRIAEDFCQLMDHLGIARCHLVGAKIGGTIARAFAARRPERFITLTVVGTPPPLRAGAAERVPDLIRDFQSHGVEYWARQNMRGRLGSDFPPDGFEWWTKFMGRTAVSTQLGFMGTIACADIRADLPNIVCPTLVITTEQSGLGTVEETHAWQQQIANSELVVLPGNSYHVAATHADNAADATLDFIARRGGGG